MCNSKYLEYLELGNNFKYNYPNFKTFVVPFKTGKQQRKPYLSNKGNEMMFAHGKHVYVLHNHHLIVVFIKYSVI